MFLEKQVAPEAVVSIAVGVAAELSQQHRPTLLYSLTQISNKHYAALSQGRGKPTASRRTLTLAAVGQLSTRGEVQCNVWFEIMNFTHTRCSNISGD